MEVISHSEGVGAAGPASFVTSLQDDHGRLGGFECELLGAYDENAESRRHLESLPADGRMDVVSRVVRSRRGFRRTLKTLVLGYLPRQQRKSNADTTTQKKSQDMDSDSIITVSTAADSMSTEVTLHDRNNSASSCLDPPSENHHRQVPVSPDATITKDDVILSGFGKLSPKTNIISNGVLEMSKAYHALWEDDGATAMTELSEASSTSLFGDESVTTDAPMEDDKQVEIPKDHYLARKDDSETSKTDCSSSNSSTSKNEREISLMEKRLIETELVTQGDLEFVPDCVSKEVLHLVDTNKMEEGTPENVFHVKTGIWEITCLDDEGNPKDPYYIVTGVSMDDRVDTKKLRKAIFAGQNYSRRPKLSIAPTDIAEGLAGYRSGTMAPICHTVPMKLYLEESLIHNVMDTKSHRLNVGSGMFGECLSISVDRFLAISSANPKGFEICPIIQARKRESK